MANVDLFLKLDGIKGDSKHALHLREIEILSYSHSHTQTGTIVGGQGPGPTGGQNRTFNDLHFTKYVDGSSASLLLACADGHHIAKGVLTMRRDEKNELIRFIMEDILVSGYNTSGSQGGEIPTDSVSITYAKGTYDFNASRQNTPPSSPPVTPKKKP